MSRGAGASGDYLGSGDRPAALGAPEAARAAVADKRSSHPIREAVNERRLPRYFETKHGLETGAASKALARLILC